VARAWRVLRWDLLITDGKKNNCCPVASGCIRNLNQWRNGLGVFPSSMLACNELRVARLHVSNQVQVRAVICVSDVSDILYVDYTWTSHTILLRSRASTGVIAARACTQWRSSVRDGSAHRGSPPRKTLLFTVVTGIRLYKLNTQHYD